MKMKRIIGTVLAALGMILGLMGCQISKDSTSTSGSGVAGTSSAVSASSVDVEPAGGAEEAFGGKYGSCSVNSSYVTGDSVIVQYDLEGKKQKTYRMDNLESVLQVTADWVYYCTEDGTKEVIWRVPIQRNGEKEKLLLKKKEKLAMENQLTLYFCAAKDYIVYEKMDKQVNLYKLDLISNEVIPLDEKYQFSNLSEDINYQLWKDVIFFVGRDKNLYCLDPVSWKAEKIYGPMTEIEEDDDGFTAPGVARQENKIYINADFNQIIVYDKDTKNVSTLLSEETMKKQIRDNKQWKVNKKEDWYVNEIFVHKNRIYFTVIGEWCQEEKVWDDLEEDGKWVKGIARHEQELVFSCDTSNPADITFEKEMSKKLKIKGEEYEWEYSEEKGIKFEFYDTALIHYFIEGKLIYAPYSLSVEDGDYYDVETGKAKNLFNDEKVYNSLHYVDERGIVQ